MIQSVLIAKSREYSTDAKRAALRQTHWRTQFSVSMHEDCSWSAVIGMFCLLTLAVSKWRPNLCVAVQCDLLLFQRQFMKLLWSKLHVTSFGVTAWKLWTIKNTWCHFVKCESISNLQDSAMWIHWRTRSQLSSTCNKFKPEECKLISNRQLFGQWQLKLSIPAFLLHFPSDVWWKCFARIWHHLATHWFYLIFPLETNWQPALHENHHLTVMTHHCHNVNLPAWVDQDKKSSSLVDLSVAKWAQISLTQTVPHSFAKILNRQVSMHFLSVSGMLWNSCGEL